MNRVLKIMDELDNIEYGFKDKNGKIFNNIKVYKNDKTVEIILQEKKE